MSSIYRIYLRRFDGTVPPDTKTTTPDAAAAAEAFETLVSRSDLEGQKWAAVLSYNNRQIAFHRFDRHRGDADYWRDRMTDIEWPTGQVGRPQRIPPLFSTLNSSFKESDMTIARYTVTFGLRGCYMPDYQGGAVVCFTRRELAEYIRDELRMLDLPASLFKEVGIRRLWSFIKRNGSSSAHFALHHKANALEFHGLTEAEYDAAVAEEDC